MMFYMRLCKHGYDVKTVICAYGVIQTLTLCKLGRLAIVVKTRAFAVATCQRWMRRSDMNFPDFSDYLLDILQVNRDWRVFRRPKETTVSDLIAGLSISL